MIIVTGGAGFIGSRLISKLNQMGRTDIVLVDDLEERKKIENVLPLKITDVIQLDEFYEKLSLSGEIGFTPSVVFHQGAISETTNWNAAQVLRLNHYYSKVLLHWCNAKSIPFIYASSASVYGQSECFAEVAENENPLNLYGYSKLLFDNYVRHHTTNTNAKQNKAVGLRYFNVYGPGEGHKGKMASLGLHLNRQMINNEKIKLFKGCDGYGDGGQRRDFVYVDDVVDANIWFWQHGASGVYNVGTGIDRSFNDLAHIVADLHKKTSADSMIEYIEIPKEVAKAYQSFTKADLSKLRRVGYKGEFRSLESGLREYLYWLNDWS